MSTSKEPDLHPAIRHGEKLGSDPASLTGYRGTAPEGWLRIHPRPSVRTAWEIRRDDVLDTEDLGKGRTRVFFKPDASMRFAYEAPFRNFGFETGHPSEFAPPLPPPLFPNANCAEHCEEEIKADGRNFSMVWRGLAHGIDYALNARGRRELYACLQRCGYSGALAFAEMQRIEARLSGTASTKKDPPWPDDGPGEPVGPAPA